jgi:nicotinic acid mononucleotide adenylyltransferase
MSNFFEELNESPWMGSICEVGVGLPFQNALVSVPGASKTVLFTRCPYSKAFQPSDVPRSVTHEMAARYASNDLEKIIANDGVQDDHIFSIAVTAAHAGASNRGMSHGWFTVVTRADPTEQPKSYSFHFRMSKDLDRVAAGLALNQNIIWFLKKILLTPDESWCDAIGERSNKSQEESWGVIDWAVSSNDSALSSSYRDIQIDIIRAPDITIEDHLLLAQYDVPLVYHHGEFKRPVDYFRSHARVLGGAFNPPTSKHLELGRGALFCLDFENPRKESITEEDMAHRVRMLDSAGVPVLINRGRKYIVDINDVVTRYGMHEPTFIIGADTFNAVCNEKYIPTPNFLEPLYRENGTRFQVINRDGLDLVDNDWSRQMNFEVVTSEGDNISSTRVRNGEYKLTTARIRQYILENKLY